MENIDVSIQHCNDDDTWTEYRATMDNDESWNWPTVVIYADGVWAGKGRWDTDGRLIVDCAADLPEEVYEAIESAFADELADEDDEDEEDDDEMGMAEVPS